MSFFSLFCSAIQLHVATFCYICLFFLGCVIDFRLFSVRSFDRKCWRSWRSQRAASWRRSFSSSPVVEPVADNLSSRKESAASLKWPVEVGHKLSFHELCGSFMVFPTIGDNRGAPKSSILIRFSITNHPFWGTPYFWKHPYTGFFSLGGQFWHPKME